MNTISIAANTLFCKRNWIGEKIILNNRLQINGRTTMNGISPAHHINNTFPNEIIIKIYRKVHTGPKTAAGGAHLGFFNFAYRLFVVVFFISEIFLIY
jgi:hypothetical protein